MKQIAYLDTVTFYKVYSNGYGPSKLVETSGEVNCLFLQGTGYGHSNNQDYITADAICYPDPQSAFLLTNNYRLEGMYVLAPFFDISNDYGWYKVTSVVVNKDILIHNLVGNIELTLKKTAKLPMVS